MRGGAFGTARSLGEDPLVLLGGEGGVNGLLLVLDLDGPRPLVRMLAFLHRHGSQGKVVLNGIYNVITSSPGYCPYAVESSCL